jgi:predicted PurR-regulated permease PerM
MNGRKARSRRSNHLTIITAIAVIAALYFGREILIPFAVALLLSLLLAPMVKRVERVGIGRVTSVILVTASSFCLVLAAGWLVVAQAQSVADNLPSYRKNIIEKTRAVRSSVRRVLGSASEAVEEIQHEIGRSETDASLSNAPQPPDPSLGDSAAGQAPTASGAIDANVEAASPEAVKVEVVAQNAGLAALTAALSSLVRPMAIAGIAFVFAIFMLIWREDLRDRVIRVFGSRRISFSTQAINDMGAAVSRYLLMLFFVNAVNGAVIALGLWLIGVPSALLWGLLMALLRFVPLIGTITAASLPILLALAIFDNWTYPLMVIALFIVVDAVSANFVEPVLYGTQIGASPMAVLAAATFWTWLWGPIGLLLAMPLTVSLVVLGRYVRPLSFLTVLLGNEPALPRELRFYQPLLSNDVY